MKQITQSEDINIFKLILKINQPETSFTRFLKSFF